MAIYWAQENPGSQENNGWWYLTERVSLNQPPAGTAEQTNRGASGMVPAYDIFKTVGDAAHALYIPGTIGFYRTTLSPVFSRNYGTTAVPDNRYYGAINLAEIRTKGSAVQKLGALTPSTAHRGFVIYVGKIFADTSNIGFDSSDSYDTTGLGPMVLTGQLPTVPISTPLSINIGRLGPVTNSFRSQIVAETATGRTITFDQQAFIHEPAGPVDLLVTGPGTVAVSDTARVDPAITGSRRAGGITVASKAKLTVHGAGSNFVGASGVTLPATDASFTITAGTYHLPITINYDGSPSTPSASPVTITAGASLTGTMSYSGSATTIPTLVSLTSGTAVGVGAEFNFKQAPLWFKGTYTAIGATSAAPPAPSFPGTSTGSVTVRAGVVTLESFNLAYTEGLVQPTFDADVVAVQNHLLLGDYTFSGGVVTNVRSAVLDGTTLLLKAGSIFTGATHTDVALTDPIPADVVGGRTPARLVVRVRTAPAAQPFPVTSRTGSAGGIIFDGANSATTGSTFSLAVDRYNDHVGYVVVRDAKVVIKPGAHPGGTRTYVRGFGQLRLEKSARLETTVDLRSSPGWYSAIDSAAVGQLHLEDGAELAGTLVLRPTTALNAGKTAPADTKCYVQIDPGGTVTISANIKSQLDATRTEPADLSLKGVGSTCVLSGTANTFGKLVLDGVTVTSGGNNAYGTTDTDLNGDAVVGSSLASASVANPHTIGTGFSVKATRAVTLSFRQLGASVVYSKGLSDGAAAAAKLSVVCLAGPGQTRLTGDSTYTGLTTVRQGALLEVGSGLSSVNTGSLATGGIVVETGGEVSFFRADGVIPLRPIATITGAGNVRWRGTNSSSTKGAGAYKLEGLAYGHTGITHVNDCRLAGPTSGASGNALGATSAQAHIQGFGQVWVYRLTGTYVGLERATLPNNITLFNGEGWQEATGSIGTYGALRLDNATLTGVITLNGTGPRLVSTTGTAGRGSELSGKLTGTASLAVTAYDGALTLSSIESDFTGGLEVRSGAVRLTGALGATATAFNYTGDISVASGATFVAANSKTQELSGKITGTGTWRKEGTASTVILSGASSDAFKFEIADGAGKVRVASTGRLGSGEKTVGAASTLTLTTQSALNNAGSLTVSGTLEVPTGVAAAGATPAVPSMVYPAGLTLKAGAVLRIGSAA